MYAYLLKQKILFLYNITTLLKFKGLLLVIRKWYWQDIVAPKKISDSFKNWQSAANKKLESNLNSKKTQGESENDSDFDDGDENDNHPSELTQVISIVYSYNIQVIY